MKKKHPGGNRGDVKLNTDSNLPAPASHVNTSEKLPPHSAQAEQSVLGSVLLVAGHAPAEAAKLLANLRGSDFYEIRNQTIYGALHCLRLDGRGLDPVSLVQWLKDKDQVEDAGGLAYVSQLPDALPTAVGFDGYLEILRDKSKRRELVRLGTQAIQWAGDEAKDAKSLIHQFTEMAASVVRNGSAQRDWIRFHTPSQCREYVAPAGHVLVGDCHIVRGAVMVIGGPPGTGKSRGAIALAVSGATCADWFGMKVHRKFKTLIIQNENGRFRLSKDFSEILGADLDNFIRVSEPPAYGMAFDKAEFRATLTRVLEEFQPDLVILDPWNSVARDDKQRDYLDAFEAIREVLPPGDAGPVLVIVAHTRKPRADERASGRGMLNSLAGSYVLGSVARSVFVMVPASDETTDDRVVWTCCKNNDGELGKRSAWHRRNGVFVPCPDFDFAAFDAPSGNGKTEITEKDLSTLFEDGTRKLPRAKAVEELMEATHCKKSAAYNALHADGRFAEYLSEKDGIMCWKT